jgi:hypothetical protein
LLVGSASAKGNKGNQTDATIRYQIARHLVQAHFDAFFPYRDGWRDARKIAQKIEIQPGRSLAVQNGAIRQEIKWRIKDRNKRKNAPALGGVATTWSYGAGDRPSYYPTMDVGDVQVTGVGKGWNVSTSSSSRLTRRPGETKASMARRGLQTFLHQQGFDALASGRDLGNSGIKVRTRGNTLLWKAGLKVQGDGRASYALGGRIKLGANGQAQVNVNVGSVRGWRVAGPRNGSGRRRHWPSGQPMRRYPAYGTKGR